MNLSSFFAALGKSLPQVIPLFRDPRVPRWMKAVLVAVAFFIISPLNFLGDLPLLGWIDDSALLALLINFFVKYANETIGMP